MADQVETPKKADECVVIEGRRYEVLWIDGRDDVLSRPHFSDRAVQLRFLDGRWAYLAPCVDAS